jgi:multidrug transporter EmrE-like cation transporter
VCYNIFIMGKIYVWLYIGAAVLVALSANYLSAVWASQENKFSSLWLLAVVIISPLVFITFGLVVSRVGVTVGSATVDLLLTLGTIFLGLFIFHEWSSLSLYQYAGIALAIGGIILMQFSK